MPAASILLGILVLPGIVAQSLLTVTTSNGTVQGGQCTTSNGTQFLAIPYAQPPVGALRFAPPRSYDRSYDGTLNATASSPGCIQFGTAFVESGPQSEDCLLLDIWVPGNATSDSALPVKVWIHGGSNTAGGVADPAYNGCNLATDALVVSINYRLGPLGYLTLQNTGLSGNLAVQDLLLGLRWVQDNIAVFGGDPGKVLLFGQSAGASLSFVLSTLPEAASIMNAVISESGGGRDYPMMNSTTVQSYMAQFVRNLNCGPDDLDCIKSKSVSELNSSIPHPPGASIDNTANVNSFGPYIDGTIIPAQPSHVGVRVPAIFGSTTMEGTLFVLGGYPFPPTAEHYTAFLTKNFGYSLAATIQAHYPLSAFSSTPFPAFYALTAVITDYAYLCPAHRALLRAAEKQVPAWVYLWGHVPSCPWYASLPVDPQVLRLLNATHAAELPFVFATTRGLPPPDGDCTLSDAERDISSFFVGAWTSMAGTGGPGRPDWPPFSAASSVGMVVGSEHVEVGELDYRVCELWDRVADAISKNATASIDGSGTKRNAGPNTSLTAGGSEPATSTNIAGLMKTSEVLLAMVLVGLGALAICDSSIGPG